MAGENRRERYRLEYPRSERPTLVTTGRRLEVLDCSESGLLYALPAHEPPPPVGSEISGTLDFRSRGKHVVAGVVHRVHDGAVAVRFTGASLPFATVLAEQKYLRTHYLAPARDR